MFDTLIGNTDRHQDNFGMIKNEITHQKRMATLYDNSSSMGRELSEERIQLLLKDPRMFDAYLFNKKSSSLIKWGNLASFEKISSFELLRRVKSVHPALDFYLKQVESLTDDQIDMIIHSVPEIMSDLKKTFVSKVLKKRRDTILKEI